MVAKMCGNLEAVRQSKEKGYYAYLYSSLERYCAYPVHPSNSGHRPQLSLSLLLYIHIDYVPPYITQTT